MFRIAMLLFVMLASTHFNYAQVQTGLDRVLEYKHLFQNQRLGIITNHTGYDQNGQFIADAFRAMDKVTIAALFGPEHGIKGAMAAGRHVQDGSFADTIPVYSLYGKNRKPTKDMLHNVDVLVFDIQDIGSRFYTYIWTMALGMEAASEHNLPFIVLDRPNPINGVQVEGAVLDTAFASFVGKYAIPVRHGMTVGELAKMFKGQQWIDADHPMDLTVVPVKGWKRQEWYDQTGLSFISPSPNMPDLQTATVYPGLCLLEGINVSEGRGTKQPFLQFGAPWIDSETLTDALNALNRPGVRFIQQQFTPESLPSMAPHPKFEDQVCYGARVEVTDRNLFQPFRTGVYIVDTLHRLYSDSLKWREAHFDRLCGTDAIRLAITERKDLSSLMHQWEKDLQAFENIRKKYLIYK
ncbi:MAG: DUF1343 domain-containing protein [Caldithrix sp.]|nr:DUF1343 domain-containing protein [Caldithrix sp.]